MGNLVNNFSKDIIRLVKRESTPLTNMIRDMIEEWRSIMPMILDLGNKSLKQKHWEAMFSFIGQEFIFSNNLDLHKIRSVNLLSYPDLIADTVATVGSLFSQRAAC
uniref:Dynein heavy chain linker domain-containing protein n=1 Tax=Spongospora subterranea TaxID=70186 RepID=A0A0H5RBK9_9EUKA|eukprot:CRZ11605.1 hypothetical protein [Spongospora subterranea]